MSVEPTSGQPPATESVSPKSANPSPKSDEPTAKPAELPASGHYGCLWLIVVFCVIAAGVYGVHRWFPEVGKSLFPEEKAANAKRLQRPSIPVIVATARRGDMPIYLDAPGTVTPLNTVTVRTRVDGQILKVNFKEGETIHEGDVLFEIDPRPYQATLTQAQGQLARDEALLQNAKLDLVRYQVSLPGEAISQQQRDTAIAAVAQYQGIIKTDEGQIQSADLQVTYTRIAAPITGKIGLRLVDKGNIVHASDSAGLAVITQIEPITVTFNLAEDYLPRALKAFNSGTKLPVEVRNRDKTILLSTGTLLAVDSQIDLATLTAKFKAIFENKDHALFPNQAVNVRLLVDTKKDTVLIPAAGVQHNLQLAFAYVVKADDTVTTRMVTTGPAEGDELSVEHGLSPGDIVVTDGVDKLEPGMKVTMPGSKEASTRATSGTSEAASPRGEGSPRRRSH